MPPRTLLTATATLDDGLLHDIFRAEWAHRRRVQRQLAATQQLLLDLLLFLAPQAVNQRLTQQPAAEWTAGDWQALVLAARRSGRGWWTAAQHNAQQAQLAALQAETAALRRQAVALQVETVRLSAAAQRRSHEADAPLWQAAPLFFTSANIFLPPLPATAPPPYAPDFSPGSWRRCSHIIALLALTGWAAERLLSETLAQRYGIAAASGSLRRLFKKLHDLGYARRFTQAHALGRSALILLTDRGRALAQALHVTPTASEWQRLQRLRPDTAAGQRALLCLLASHARRLGYAAGVAPKTLPAADVLLGSLSGEWLHVLVEDDPATPQPQRWQALADAQGEVAICATTPEHRQAVVISARAMGMRGRAIDLSGLRGQITGDLGWQRFPPPDAA